jgi:hypothetical protein
MQCIDPLPLYARLYLGLDHVMADSKAGSRLVYDK